MKTVMRGYRGVFEAGEQMVMLQLKDVFAAQTVDIVVILVVAMATAVVSHRLQPGLEAALVGRERVARRDLGHLNTRLPHLLYSRGAQ